MTPELALFKFLFLFLLLLLLFAGFCVCVCGGGDSLFFEMGSRITQDCLELHVLARMTLNSSWSSCHHPNSTSGFQNLLQNLSSQLHKGHSDMAA